MRPILDTITISNVTDLRYSIEAKSLTIQSMQLEHGTEYDLLIEINTEALREIILGLKRFAGQYGMPIEDLGKPPIVQ